MGITESFSCTSCCSSLQGGQDLMKFYAVVYVDWGCSMYEYSSAPSFGLDAENVFRVLTLICVTDLIHLKFCPYFQIWKPRKCDQRLQRICRMVLEDIFCRNFRSFTQNTGSV